MNILFICNNMPPMVDGVGDYTYNIASEFARHGHEVHVICRKRKEIRTDYDDLHIVPMVERWDRSTGKRIAQYVKDNHIDVVSLQYVPHGFHPKGLPFGLVPCMKEVKKTGVKMMVFCHEVCIGMGKWHEIKQNAMAILMESITRGIVRMCSVVITSISHYKQRLKGLGVEDVAVVSIPSNIPNAVIGEEQRKALRHMIANDDEIVITLFGNRNFTNVLKAIHKLLQSGHKIIVLALGKINASIPQGEPYIYYTGAREIAELASFIQVSDMLVLPENTHSGCSLKSGSLSAAIQFHVPVISNKGFMTEDVLDSVVYYTESDTVDEYERTIKVLMNDIGLRDCMKRSCVALSKHLNWQSTYEMYIKNIQYEH